MTPRPLLRLFDLVRLLSPRISHAASALLTIATFAAVLIVGCMARGHGAECPDWCIRGLIAVETSSHFKADGTVVYVNKARGKDGEVGITQAMPKTLRAHGFSPSLFEQDTTYALSATRSILCGYYQQTGTWWMAVAKWRMLTTYQSPTAQDYARRVSAAAGE